MGHILLLILKILGILILVIIGLVIVLLASVLFIPVRYSLDGNKTENEVTAKIRFHWFLHIISFCGWYDGETFSTRLRIFGIPLNSRKDTKEDDEKGQAKGDKQSNKQTDTVDNTTSQKLLDTETHEDSSIEELSKSKQLSNDNKTKNKQTMKKHISIIEKIKNFFRKLKYTWQKICDMLKTVCASTHTFLEFIQAETTKQAFVLTRGELKYLFKHLKPRKVKGELIIGFEDPSVTGQFLAATSLFYPFLGEKIKIYPNFENEVLEGNIRICGHMRSMHGLRTIWHLYRDKNIKQIIKRFQRKR